MTTTYVSQAARDAQASGYGGPSYWAMLDETAIRHQMYFAERGDPVKAAEMITRSLSAALMGNDGD